MAREMPRLLRRIPTNQLYIWSEELSKLSHMVPIREGEVVEFVQGQGWVYKGGKEVGLVRPTPKEAAPPSFPDAAEVLADNAFEEPTSERDPLGDALADALDDARPEYYDPIKAPSHMNKEELQEFHALVADRYPDLLIEDIADMKRNFMVKAVRAALDEAMKRDKG